MHTFSLREKANVPEAAVWRVSVKWEYLRKAFCLLSLKEFIFTNIKTL